MMVNHDGHTHPLEAYIDHQLEWVKRHIQDGRVELAGGAANDLVHGVKSIVFRWARDLNAPEDTRTFSHD